MVLTSALSGEAGAPSLLDKLGSSQGGNWDLCLSQAVQASMLCRKPLGWLAQAHYGHLSPASRPANATLVT
jgi:hypothetical protein